jgi:DNA repair exonuclease SbcCD ATPase subunit
MLLKELSLVNILNFKQLDLKFSDINIVFSLSEVKNGVGKSSLLSIIMFSLSQVLYMSGKKIISHSEIVRSGCKSAKLKATFDDNGSSIVIGRDFDYSEKLSKIESTYYIIKDGEPLKEKVKQSYMQSIQDQAKLFYNLNFFSPAKESFFSSDTNKKIETINLLFDVINFEKIYKVITEDLKNINNKISIYRVQLTDLKSKEESIKSNLSKLDGISKQDSVFNIEPYVLEIENQEKIVLELNSVHKTLQSRKAPLLNNLEIEQKRLEETRNEYNKFVESIASIENEKYSIAKQIDKLEKAIKMEHQKCPTCMRIVKEEDIPAILSEVSLENMKLTELNAIILEKKNLVIPLSESISKLSENIASLKTESSDIKSEESLVISKINHATEIIKSNKSLLDKYKETQEKDQAKKLDMFKFQSSLNKELTDTITKNIEITELVNTLTDDLRIKTVLKSMLSPSSDIKKYIYYIISNKLFSLIVKYASHLGFKYTDFKFTPDLDIKESSGLTYSAFSTGEQQKINFSYFMSTYELLLQHRNKINMCLFDEIAANLDAYSERKLYEIVSRCIASDNQIFIVSNNMNSVLEMKNTFANKSISFISMSIAKDGSSVAETTTNLYSIKENI